MGRGNKERQRETFGGQHRKGGCVGMFQQQPDRLIPYPRARGFTEVTHVHGCDIIKSKYVVFALVPGILLLKAVESPD